MPHQPTGESLLIREQKGRTVMGKPHRLFHRRQAQNTPNVLTVNVEVVATLDATGNVIGQETVTPAVATVAAVPSVPSVPPFPSDLTVPAYPWPSGVPTVQATDTSAQPASTAPAVTSVGFSSSIFPTASGYNSTSSSFTSTASSLRNSTSSISSVSTSSSSRSSSSSSLSSTQISTTSVPTSSAASTTGYWIGSSTGGGGGGGYVDPAQTGAPSSTPSTAPATDSQSSGTPLGTPQVVGTVFGSLAGLALLAALILFLIRRHKRNQNGGALQLTGDDHTDTDQPMTQPVNRSSFVTPSFLNRFSGASRSTAESSGTGERSFQRISGRKLPSAFSEGMTSEQFAATARGEGTLSGSSFYHDDKGFYGGPGVLSKDFGKDPGFEKEIAETSHTGAMGTEERVRPSPARTPVIHHADDAPWGTSRSGGGTLSPPLTPNPDFPPRGTLGRSHPSHDGSRSSRFTENV